MRAEGYYWVKLNPQTHIWVIVQWDANWECWWRCGDERTYDDKDFYKIGPIVEEYDPKEENMLPYEQGYSDYMNDVEYCGPKFTNKADIQAYNEGWMAAQEEVFQEAEAIEDDYMVDSLYYE